MNATRTTAPAHTDEQIVEAYERTGSVYKAGEALGVNHSTVHRRLQKLGRAKPMNLFTDQDRDRLRKDYLAYRDRGELDALASEMGRTKQFLCRQAGKLGLTDQSSKKPWTGFWTSKTEDEIRELFNDFKRSLQPPAKFCEERGISENSFWKHMSTRWPDEWEYAVESAWAEDSCYRIGRVFEFKTRDHLIELGYHATRSNRSSTPADVIAFRHGEILMIQCKTDRHTFSADEWNDLYDIADSTGAIPLLAFPSPQGHIELRRIRGHKSSVRHEPQNTAPFTPGT